MDSLVLQTALGLVFLFAVFAALASVLTELVTRFVGLRGEYLLRGIRTLVDGKGHFQLGLRDLVRRTATEPTPGPGEPNRPFVTEVVSHTLVNASADKATMPANAGNAKLPNRQRRKVPSYVSGRSFARALIDLVIGDPTGRTTAEDVEAALRSRTDLPDPLRTALLALLADAKGDIAEFRHNVEQWYDDHMARVSGWYKRHVRWVTLGIGVLLVLLFNLSAVEIARSLYTDQALRGARGDPGGRRGAVRRPGARRVPARAAGRDRRAARGRAADGLGRGVRVRRSGPLWLARPVRARRPGRRERPRRGPAGPARLDADGRGAAPGRALLVRRLEPARQPALDRAQTRAAQPVSTVG